MFSVFNDGFNFAIERLQKQAEFAYERSRYLRDAAASDSERARLLYHLERGAALSRAARELMWIDEDFPE